MLLALLLFYYVINIFNYKQIVAGKMMEQGPVLVVTFIAQQIMVVRDSLGKIKEGDPVCVYISYYHLCSC